MVAGHIQIWHVQLCQLCLKPLHICTGRGIYDIAPQEDRIHPQFIGICDPFRELLRGRHSCFVHKLPIPLRRILPFLFGSDLILYDHMGIRQEQESIFPFQPFHVYAFFRNALLPGCVLMTAAAQAYR